MTMSTPILGLPPGPAPATATGFPAGNDAGEVFLALVQGLLDGTPGQTEADPTGTPAGTPADPTADPTDVDTEVPDAPDLTDLATAVSSAGVLPAPIVPPLVQEAGSAGPDVPAAVAGVESIQAALPTPRAAEPAAPPTDGLAPVDTPAPAAVPADPGDQGTAPDQGRDPGTPADPTPVTGVGAVAPMSATPATPAPADPHRIGHQVFPEVVKVVTNPEGPRRVTVKLNPESLGEVRVVLTSRRGGLDVSLAGGAEARRALADGAPELQRLLDAVGRGDSRITVRDLTGAPMAPVQAPVIQPTSATSTGLSADLAGGWGTGTGQPGGQPGTQEHPRGDSTAMDGTPASTTPSRRTETVTEARTGLDVTM